MVKAYLRYVHDGAWGVIHTAPGNILLDSSGLLAYVPALESVKCWNMRTGVEMADYTPPRPVGPGSSDTPMPAVTCLAIHGRSLAAGYHSGIIHVWNLENGTINTTFTGHSSPVSVLRFSSDGSTLASGGADTDVILWDVIAEVGRFRLKGHSKPVRDLAFLPQAQHLLVSGSEDTLVKVWDLNTQSCIQTIVGHRSEVSALDVSPDGAFLVTAAAEPDLRLYHVASAESLRSLGTPVLEEGQDPDSLPSISPVLQEWGRVDRSCKQVISTLRFSPDGKTLLVQGTERFVEVYTVRTDEEVASKAARRVKRAKEKAKNAEDAETVAEPRPAGPADKLAHTVVVHTSTPGAPTSAKGSSSKIRAAAMVGRTLVTATGNNALLSWKLTMDTKRPSYDLHSQVDLPGHRSDIRSLALSSDDSLIASGSAESVKIWNARSGTCIRTMPSKYVLSACWAPGNRHIVVGTKSGALQIYDVNTAALLEDIPDAHSGAVWALWVDPSGKGLISGSADKTVKFWDWTMRDVSPTSKVLSLMLAQSMTMTDDVLGIKVSPNGTLLCVALLDSTVKVFYKDTLKFFLSLYGHKLPVLSMDISSDSTLLATGSADKNIKIWGLDFGDVHKSIFAHTDSVMGIAWVPDTHYLFSVGKDGLVKYWDGDSYEQILSMAGHGAEVWSLALSSNAAFLVTAGHDRSIRRWQRTDEQLFLEEERELALEKVFEGKMTASAEALRGAATPKNAPEDGANSGSALGSGTATVAGVAQGDGLESGPAGRVTLDAVKAGEALVEALEIAETERAEIAQWEVEAAAAAAANPDEPVEPRTPNMMLLGLSPDGYVLRALRRVRPSELDETLLVLPFSGVLRLLDVMVRFLESHVEVERCVRIVQFLTRVFHTQLAGDPRTGSVLEACSRAMMTALNKRKDVIGFNMAGLQFAARQLDARSEAKMFDDVILTRVQQRGMSGSLKPGTADKSRDRKKQRTNQVTAQVIAK